MRDSPSPETGQPIPTHVLARLAKLRVKFNATHTLVGYRLVQGKRGRTGQVPVWRYTGWNYGKRSYT